jgi:hypothetical protein
MKLKLLSIILLSSIAAYGQKGDSAGNKAPVYVMLAPEGKDTDLEVRSSMRIQVAHMDEGQFVGYRFKDKAFLVAFKSEAKADAAVSKLKSNFRYSKVQKLHLDSYVNAGFNEVKNNGGRKDPSFPVYYETGDNPLDARSYRIEKLDWITNHPMEGDAPLPGTTIPNTTK